MHAGVGIPQQQGHLVVLGALRHHKPSSPCLCPCRNINTIRYASKCTSSFTGALETSRTPVDVHKEYAANASSHTLASVPTPSDF